jgi:outer membrane protein assembly factor BamA
VETPVNKEEVDLTITMSEGKLGKVGTIQVIGNKTVPTGEIESKLTFKSGDQFSVISVFESIRAIGTIGNIDPDKVHPIIAPQNYDPKDEFITVNVGFQVTEK